MQLGGAHAVPKNSVNEALHGFPATLRSHTGLPPAAPLDSLNCLSQKIQAVSVFVFLPQGFCVDQ